MGDTRIIATGGLFLILLGWSTANAQVSTTCTLQSNSPSMITYGQRLTGCSLKQTTSQDSYFFIAASNDLARISLSKGGGQGIPCVEIFDPDGVLVAGQNCLTDLRLTLSQAGRYQVVVLAQRATAVFQYDLRLDRLFPISPTSVAIGIGDMQADQISYLGQYNLYHFAGFPGQIMWMDMTQRTGPGVPCIQIYGPSRKTIFGPYCTRGGLTLPLAFFTFTLADRGSYVISVNEQGDDQMVGYQLRLQRIKPSLAWARKLDFDSSIQGEVGPLGKMEFAYFDGAQGDIVSGQYASTFKTIGGGFYNPDGSWFGGAIEIGGGYSFAGYTLPTTGTYSVLLSGPNDDQIDTYSNFGTASYTLTVSCVGQCPPTRPDSVATLSASPPALSAQIAEGSTALLRPSIRVLASNDDSQLLITPVTDSWLSLGAVSTEPLPTDLQVTIDPKGLAVGIYTSRLLLQSESGALVEIPVNLVVTAPALTVTTSSIPAATVGVPYGPVQLVASGSTGSTRWTQAGLPSSTGLALSAAGVLSGTPSPGSQGSYPMTVTASSAGATATAQITLTINGATNVSVLNFRLLTSGGAILSDKRLFNVANDTSGPATVTVVPSVSWIKVSTSQIDLATGAEPKPVSVQIDRTALPAGSSYVSGTISLQGLSSPKQVEVNVALQDQRGLPLLSRSAMTFYIQQSQLRAVGDNLTQTVTIINDGFKPVGWIIESSDPIVSVNPPISTARLQPGDFASVQITVSDRDLTILSSDSKPRQAVLSFLFDDNSLAEFPVSVVVSQAALPSELLLDQTGLIFVGTEHQTIGIHNYTTQDYSVSITPLQSWIKVLPTSATVKQRNHASLDVSVDSKTAPLESGLARGWIAIGYQNSSNVFSQKVEVLFLGAQTVSSSGLTSLADGVRGAACLPISLRAVFSSLSEGATVAVGLPSQIDVKITDDCGNAVKTGAAAVSFSNGDSPVTLLPDGNGSWQGTWVPRSGKSAALFMAAVSGQQYAFGTATRSVQLDSSGVKLPSVPAGAVLNAASLTPSVDRVAPGSIISIFGDQLATGTAAATSSLPYSLGSTAVRLGKTALPLFYVSPTQINALVPPDLQLDPTTSLVVESGGFQSIPVPVVPLPTDPGIFGGAVVSATGKVNGPTAPAQRGDTVAIYCTGLGPVTESLDPTRPAPSDRLVYTKQPVAVFIQGPDGQLISSLVRFAGLAPGYSGLYQVNVQIPDGAATGDKVQLYVSTGARDSNHVSISIR